MVTPEQLDTYPFLPNFMNKPTICAADDQATFNRLHPIPFTATIPAAEVDEGKVLPPAQQLRSAPPRCRAIGDAQKHNVDVHGVFDAVRVFQRPRRVTLVLSATSRVVAFSSPDPDFTGHRVSEFIFRNNSIIYGL